MSDTWTRYTMSEVLNRTITYGQRNGESFNLEDFIVKGSLIARPERDVLRALLQFCLDGLDHMDAKDKMDGLKP